MRLFTSRSVRRALLGTTAVFVTGFVAIQFVPIGRDHTNPPVVAEPQWDSPRTRELVAQACFDCHSNETHWPWYSNIAPISWWTQDHVEEGRSKLNFSEWGIRRQESDEIVEVVDEGEMPPWYYKMRFWDRMSAQDHDEMLAGLVQTFGQGREGER